MPHKMWKDIAIGDTFKDGSKVVSIHDRYISECYDVNFKINPLKTQHCVLSKSHLLLCDISKTKEEIQKWVEESFGSYSIPTLYDKHIYYENLMDQIKPVMTSDEILNVLNSESEEKYEVINADSSQISENEFWLPVEVIFMLVRIHKQKILCNKRILNVDFVGNKEVFCVETDTHKFETCGLIHHNSVTLRNIIFHCLTHSEQISIALIDLKWTEFVPFKGVKNVVAVANTVPEAAEVMRLGREIMNKRNQEMAKLGINDIKDFKPQKPTEEVIIAGRKLHDTDTVEIRLPNGEEKTVTVKELEGYLQ